MFFCTHVTRPLPHDGALNACSKYNLLYRKNILHAKIFKVFSNNFTVHRVYIRDTFGKKCFEIIARVTRTLLNGVWKKKELVKTENIDVQQTRAKTVLM